MTSSFVGQQTMGKNVSKIILLNGCSSAGKTSISRSMQYLSDELWLTFGVDSFIDMIPSSKEEQYLKFTSGKNEHGVTCTVDDGPVGYQLFGLIPTFATMMADAGHNLIIDEVLLDDSYLKSYVENLSNHIVYYVGVFCDLKLMQEREILRGNRSIGLSNDQITRVHQGRLNSYDFKIDTSNISSFSAASQILDFVKNNPDPQSFREFVWSNKP
jgi:chloramphenicol 3-O phosphotransferase